MNANDLQELFEIDAEARRLGASEERDRLRPLLELLEADLTILSRVFGFVEPASLADLRRELGLEEQR